MAGRDLADRYEVAFDELLIAVTAFLNDVDSREDLRWRAKVAEKIANLGEPDEGDDDDPATDTS